MSPAGPELDASVCYRHPDRTSWTLCERCGRTICPECQILTPQGLRCPTCIEEQGGSVQWTPAGRAAQPAPRRVKARRQRARSGPMLEDRPAWQRVLLQMLRPGDETPVLSWGAAGLALVLWIPGFFTDLVTQWLVVAPGFVPTWQVWRFITTSFVYLGGIGSILSLLLGIVFLLLNGPAVERQLGRARFAALFLVAGATGAAWMAIAGYPALGLFTPIFGLLGCYVVLAWNSPAARAQMLIMLGFLVVVNLVLSPSQIFAMLGGFGAGAGSMLLFRRYESSRSTRTPYLLMIGGAAFFVVIAIVRGLVAGGL